MAVSYVGAGTRSVAVNGNTIPGLPSGLAAGDLLVILDTVHRDRTTSVPSTPTTPPGWQRRDTTSILGTTRSMRLSWYYRPWQSGDSAPTINYGPTGVTTDEHVSRMIALRGALTAGDPTNVLGNSPTEQSASSTVMGPVPGVDTTVAGCLALVAAMREANATAVSTLSGDGLTWAEIDEYHGTTSPNVYSRAWDYAPVPNAQTITSKSFSITAGSSIQSAGQMWVIAPPAAGRPSDFMVFLGLGHHHEPEPALRRPSGLHVPRRRRLVVV